MKHQPDLSYIEVSTYQNQPLRTFIAGIEY